MRDQQLRVIQGTTSDLEGVEGPCDVWGIVVVGTTTGVAQVDLHDNASTTSTILLSLITVTYNGTNFEKSAGIMLPRPVRFSKALSVNVSGTEQFYIYLSGFRQN